MFIALWANTKYLYSMPVSQSTFISRLHLGIHVHTWTYIYIHTYMYICLNSKTNHSTF